MDEFDIQRLPLHGYQGRLVPNLFFRLNQSRPALAVIFPGLTYSADMPLLFYTSALLRQRGCDILQVRADYTLAEYQNLPPLERANWLFSDARAALEAGRQQGSYARIVLVGKSIGTLALAYLVSQPASVQTVTIWLTPLLRQGRLVEAASQSKNPALFVASNADPTYDASAMQSIQKATSASFHLVEGANHSLELPGDPFRSLAILNDVIQQIASFLDRSGFETST